MSTAPFGPNGGDRDQSVVVIGAGHVGLACALWLQRKGHKVVLLDRAFPDDNGDFRHAASYGNACTVALGACIPVATPGILAKVPGMLLDKRSPLSLHWRDLPGLLPWLLSFVRSSSQAEVSRIAAVIGRLLRAAESGHAPLMADSGSEDLLRKTGCLYLFRSEAQYTAARRDIDLRAREQVAMTLLTRNEVHDMEPGLSPVYHAAVRFDEAYLIDNPHKYARRLFALFLSRGGSVAYGQARGFAQEADSAAVRLEDRYLKASQVVVAAGAWARPLAQLAGDSMLLDTERGYHVNFPQDGRRINAPCCYPAHGFYMTPLEEGLRVAGTVELGGLGRPARDIRTQVIEAAARELVSGLGIAGETWLGFRPSMPDSLPVIGRSTKHPRIIYAFGHGHIGLTLAGITGRLVAEIASGETPSEDLSALRPDRPAVRRWFVRDRTLEEDGRV